jgi:hypothetical protein
MASSAMKKNGPYRRGSLFQWDNLVVFYHLNESEILPDKSGGLIKGRLLYKFVAL